MPRPIPAHHAAPLPGGAGGSCADGRALGDGAAREALRQAMHRLDQAEAAPGQAAALCDALTEVARALAGLHAYSPAQSYLARAQGWARVMGATDLRADLACAWAEVATNAADLALAQGEPDSSVRQARDRARDQAFEAARLAGQTTDPHWEIKVLLRASDVFDRCGDHDDAVQMQHRAMVLMGLHDPDLPRDTGHPAEPGHDGLRLAAPGRLM